MNSRFGRLALVSLTCFILTGCGGSQESAESPPTDDSTGEDGSSAEGSNGKGDNGEGDNGGGDSVTINGNEALSWGDGPYGVVLAHGAAFDAASWQDQAPVIADTGATVVAVEDIDPEGINDAVTYLHDKGIDDVALVGGSAGADSILDLASTQPDLPDQLILLSPNSPVDGLGEEPKLFIASEDESGADVSTELAQTAPGSDNQAILLPGSAHAQNIFDTDQAEPVLDAMIERLTEFSTP